MSDACRALALLPAAGLLLFAAGCGPIGEGGEEMRFHSGGDLVAMGSLVEIDDSIERDVMAVGRDIRFMGHAGGAFLGVGAAQSLEGSTEGSLRAVGGGLRVTGAAGANATLLGAEVLVDRGADIGLNAYLLGARVEQRGTVGGHLRIAAREVVLDGPVVGDVDVIASTLTIGPSAQIGGELSYRVRQGGVTIDPAAVVLGGISEVTVPEPSPVFAIVMGMARVAAFLLAGSLLLMLAPPLRRAAHQLDERALPAFGLGLLWLVAIPVMTAAAFVTVVGIPVAIIAGLLYWIALYLAPALPGLWLGRSLLDRPGAPPTPPVRAFLLGGAVVGTAMLIPWIGFPMRLLAIALGFGCVVLVARDGLSASGDRG